MSCFKVAFRLIWNDTLYSRFFKTNYILQMFFVSKDSANKSKFQIHFVVYSVLSFFSFQYLKTLPNNHDFYQNSRHDPHLLQLLLSKKLKTAKQSRVVIIQVAFIYTRIVHITQTTTWKIPLKKTTKLCYSPIKLTLKTVYRVIGFCM